MDLSVPGQVIPIESEEQYASYLAKEDLPISISFFWADFQPQCAAGGQMDIIFTQLAMMHPRLRFMKIEADREQLQAISEQNEIEVVPTFIVKQGKHVLEKLQGVQISELAKRVDVLNKSIASKKQSKAEQEDQTNRNSTDSVVDEAIEYRLKKLINASSVMLFMKGNPSEPKCGFSRQTIALLKSENIQFGSFDILADPEVRQALKVYSNWPTYPQLYVNGKLIGGLDILKEMTEDGESLAEQLELTENVANGEKKLFASLKELVHSAPVLLFMKGNPNEPKCGFSRKTVAILREHEISFSTFDILTDDQVRQGLKKFSNWPTFPQLYVNGQLIGGLDIITEMAEEGDLADQLGVEKKEKLEDKLKKLISQSPVMVFMKGNPSNPQCGFSRTLVALLNEAGFKYGSFDILSDNAVRQGLKTFSNWPTYPQLYINGELIGGLDIVQQMKEDGELEELRP